MLSRLVRINDLEKGISGQQVRALIRSNGNWKELVPLAVANFICQRAGNGL